MKFSITALAFVASVDIVAAASRGEGYLGKIRKFDVNKYADRFRAKNETTCVAANDKTFVVMYDPYDEKDDPIEAAVNALSAQYGKVEGFQTFRNPQFSGAVFQGNCANAITKDLVADMVDIATVEDVVEVNSFLSNGGAPYGLQVISNERGAAGSQQGQDFTYSFEDPNLGKGVDLYVVDTGIRTSHAVFTGRAIQGFTFNTSQGGEIDGDGHGTHCAGTAGGAKFGVAQGANIIAVKVLGNDGSGSSASTILGMDWVINRHAKRKLEPGFVGSVMSMSWGLQGESRLVDDAVRNASAAGIHISVAAGNDAGADACKSTPAKNGGDNSNVVTVGAVNIRNTVSTFSNVGKCVDIYAPGEETLSAWFEADNMIKFLSGTSMACPHVSGVMAYLLAKNPEKFGQDPAALKAHLLATARKGKIIGDLKGRGDAPSQNLLLSNGFDGQIPVQGRGRRFVVPAQGEGELSPVLGGPTSWAKHLVDNLGKRWQLHSSKTELRF